MAGRGGKGKEMEGRDGISTVWLTEEKRKQRISYPSGPTFSNPPKWGRNGEKGGMGEIIRYS